MADDDFQTNLLRAIASELHLQTGLQAGREMFGKSYFELGAGEKAAVDQAVLSMIGANYNWLTPELLRSQESQQPVGFQAPDAVPKQES